MRAPLFLARVGIDREGIVLGSPVERAIDLKEARLKSRRLLGVVAAQDMEVLHRTRTDLFQRHESFRRERTIVAGPLHRSGVCRYCGPDQRGCDQPMSSHGSRS